MNVKCLRIQRQFTWEQNAGQALLSVELGAQNSEQLRHLHQGLGAECLLFQTAQTKVFEAFFGNVAFEFLLCPLKKLKTLFNCYVQMIIFHSFQNKAFY